jgi:hypothetical protein
MQAIPDEEACAHNRAELMREQLESISKSAARVYLCATSGGRQIALR